MPSAGSFTLVVCEKPGAARRIAHALGPAREDPAARSVFRVAGDQNYVVCAASGHLYGLRDAGANRGVFPALDLEWAPAGKNPRALRIIRTIAELARGASSFIHACDYDQEGEVIGYSILQYACRNKYAGALRAKFSTLTDEEIRQSFASLEPTNGGLAEAGRSRHMLDFIYGVNLSRALAASFRAGGSGYRNLSIGRVQGPTLAFAAEREFEINLHVPDPYWTVSGEFESGDGSRVRAGHERPRIGKLAEAQAIVADCPAGGPAVVESVERKGVSVRPPTPFNIGDLQKEAYRLFRVSPGYTLAIAEKLYLSALISYPRTSSQKLPAAIGYEKIISQIAQAGGYGQLASMLLSRRGRLSPNEGPKTDPAHPAIYPTGVAPKSRLGGLEFKVYDLIVRRFLATFGDPAAGSKTQVLISAGGASRHLFMAEGRTITYDGWMVFYRPYVQPHESHSLPAGLASGQPLRTVTIEMQEKFTQPPFRYSQSSLLSKMEQEGVGTKATRADIISTLFKRGYLDSVRGPAGGIKATGLGLAVVESMRRYVPQIVSASLTKSMEEQLEKVEAGEATGLQIIERAVDMLVESLAEFRLQRTTIGSEIGQATATDTSAAAALGQCPVCKSGTLRVIKSRTTKKRFIGCSNYGAGCRTSAPLPQRGALRLPGKSCKDCSWPMVQVIFSRRAKPWTICPNTACPSRAR